MATGTVLVVGAGPVGLAMACNLRSRGIDTRIIEALPQRTDKSKALGIQARTLEVLDSMGIVDRFIEAGHKIHGTNVYAGGSRIVHIGFEDIDSPFQFILLLPQADTERLLAERLTELGGNVEREVKLLSFTQDADGVTALLQHADGRQETSRVDWLVGCDGAHSTTRHQLGLPFDGLQYEEAFVLADLRIDWDLPNDEVHAFLSPQGAMVAFPLRGNTWRLAGEGDIANPTLEDMARLLVERGAPKAQLSDAKWTASFHIHRRIVPRYREDRVFLAGDAAHIHSPLGGQGMNTGIQDTHNLAWKLALAIGGSATPALLDSYSEERQPVARATLQGTDLAMKVVTLRNPIAQEARNRLIGLLTSLDVIQKKLIATASQLTIGYRASPIVDESRSSVARATVGVRVGERPTLADWAAFGGGPHPGDRAPDVEVNDETTLLSLLRHPRSTLFLFDGAAPTKEGYANLAAIATQVRDRWGAHVESWIVVPRRSRPTELGADERVLLDPKGALHKRYGAGSECLYLIRPDGYVGFRSQPASQGSLEAHLNQIVG